MDINIRIKTSIDRPHLAYQFMEILYKNNIEVIKMEVYSALIYFKIPYGSKKAITKLFEDFESIEECDSVEIVPMVASEQKDIIVHQSLDIIPQPIMIIDEEGLILYSNGYAKNRFNKKNMESTFIGEHIEEIDEDLIEKIKESKESISFMNKLNEMMINIQAIFSEKELFAGYLVSIIINNTCIEAQNPITFKDIQTQNDVMKTVIEQAKLYSKTDLPVLLRGEEGTGKELFARSIHSESDRKNMPFMSINCSDTPTQYFESELFGYEPNAIERGNKNGQKGILELANGGTVFINKIGELSILSQIRLLEVLNTGQIKRIGSDKPINIDVRFIFSSNRDIESLITKKKFRIDLYFKISNLLLNIPPLKDRKEDIPLLCNNYLRDYKKGYDTEGYNITKEAMDTLKNYNWPGNVRELLNVVDRAVVSSADRIIDKKNILSSIFGEEDIANAGRRTLKEEVDEFERKIIVEELKKNPSIRKTAEKLGVPHTLLLRRIDKFAIDEAEWK
ncbi:MAG: sigma 54-interacting transcriptional regulator [Tissierellia bacterium]|nr:sigma 54-interacting transcriptional regulator [Tissierellia bacterium]